VIGAALWRVALLVVVWWALAEGGAPSGVGAIVAVAAVAGTAWASLALRLPGGSRPRLARVPRFLAFFAWQSVRGGVDVAWRALSPAGRVQPGFVDYDPRLGEGTARAIFIEVVSVMPGTLVAEQKDAGGGPVVVHVLDPALPIESSLTGVEREVRLLFGLPARTPG
jgi:multicomponent Na+:H+ antiporter subunit E